MIAQTDLFIRSKVETSIERIRMFEPKDGYYLAFSGGKDSQCILELSKMAGVKYDAHYNVTSVDPPELIYFIRENYPDVVFDYPKDNSGNRVTMWSLIAKMRDKNHEEVEWRSYLATKKWGKHK